MNPLVIAVLVLAGVPCLLFLVNLWIYRPPRVRALAGPRPAVSVLIPARDEEANIADALRSVLANVDVELEVVVLDDHSSDRTAEIVAEVARGDARVRLERAPALPAGWCGKQHACWILSRHARNPWLVFMDADVRLAPEALARMAAFVSERDVALASGVPRQILGTFWERVLIPQIHFVLLGFLPMLRMRHSRSPAYAAGCGQLFIARARDYHACGGHSAIRASLHDGLKLPAAFRRQGLATDLFDATTVASCRMYRTGAEVLAGLGKNAIEGLAAPARIVPMTLLLAGGQVLPWALLLWSGWTAAEAWLLAGAILCGLGPRWLAAWRFRQPWSAACWHPVGVAVLLGIQWRALWRWWRGRPATWRGRAAPGLVALCVLVAAGQRASAELTNEPGRVSGFVLHDQHERPHSFHVPGTNQALIVVADHKGSDQLEQWIAPVRARHGEVLTIVGVADVSSVPSPLRGVVRRAFVRRLEHPVLLDWTGTVTRSFRPQPQVANIYLVRTNGTVVTNWAGAVSPERLGALQRLLASRAGP